MAGATLDAIQFFEQKDPRNKLGELAVAARFRELTENAVSHTKDQLGSVIKSARRNFDVRNFAATWETRRRQRCSTSGRRTR